MHAVQELFRACAQEHQPYVRKMAEVGSARADTQHVKKPRAASVVWNYFGLRADSKGVVSLKKIRSLYVKCVTRACQQKAVIQATWWLISRAQSDSLCWSSLCSTCLIKGKGTKFKEQHKSQPTIETVIKSASKYSPNSPQVLELNNAAAYYIAKDAQPFAAVERPGFWAMVAKLNPRHESTLLSLKYFGSTVKWKKNLFYQG